MRHTSVAYLNKEVLVISMKDKWKIYKIPSISGNFDLFNFKKNKKIELKYFIPKYILAGKNQKEYPLNIDDDGYYLNLDYSAKLSGKNGFFNVEKLYSLVIPKNISWINETFEVLGLLQAEMGKTNNGCVVFANHEYQIINKVIKWFEKELEITHNDWRWYIKVNLNNPKSEKYKKEVEKKVIDHWLNKAKIKKEKAYPTTVSYIKNTKNKQLRFYDYGTLIIEYKRNLLSQILKRFVKEMSYSIPKLGEEENKYFMKGILAGESSITCRKKSGHYRIHLTANESSLLEHNSTIERIGDIGEKPVTFYDTLSNAYEHQNSVEKLEESIENNKNTEDPYVDQINDMRNDALEEVDYSRLNTLVSLLDHQDFLLKLLTNKDSFIRKKIIDQNLSYLNSRLAYYLDKLGLPHDVVFQSDLSVEITELGRDLDFDNLSRGERNRLILGLSWSFRDIFESLYSTINVLFVDELIDSGMDTNGVESSLAVLKKMARDGNRSVYLISHKDELQGRVESVLSVIKENGFTSFSQEEESTMYKT